MQSEKQPSYWAAGWATFAGIMLIMLGIFHAFAGLAEVVDPDAYVTTENYVFKLSSDAWGWIHLIGGIIVFFAGWGALAEPPPQAVMSSAATGRAIQRELFNGEATMSGFPRIADSSPASDANSVV